VKEEKAAVKPCSD